MPIRSQEVVAKQAPKGRERIHGDLSGEAIEEQGCSRGLLDPARLAIVGGKRETAHRPPDNAFACGFNAWARPLRCVLFAFRVRAEMA
jgi:hypothetical protein